MYSVLPALPGGLHLAGTGESEAAAAQGREDTRTRLLKGKVLPKVYFGLVSLNIIEGGQERFLQGVSQRGGLLQPLSALLVPNLGLLTA